MSRLGWADLGLATFNDMVANASMIASLSPGTPVIADADTGYGGPVMITKTVQAYARAGVAALHLEDQVQEKRCGHLTGKQLVDRETFFSRIAAASAARDAIGSDMMIIARTDANADSGFEEAVERLKGAKQRGADMLFLEALKTDQECQDAIKTFDGTPLLFNNVPGGASPDLSYTKARELGFRIVVYPCACLGAVFEHGSAALKYLKDNGKEQDTDYGVRKMFEISGLNDAIAIDKQAGGRAYVDV